MKTTDAPRFFEAIALTAEALRTELPSQPALQDLFEMLECFRLPDVLEALRRIRRTFEFFPKPVELLTVVREVAREREEREQRVCLALKPAAENLVDLTVEIPKFIAELAEKMRMRA